MQKTHVGPFAFFGGTNVQYTTDTTGGNSGSPVIFEDTGEAIGIHTHAGCNSGGGANNGTGINHPGLQDYLANPQGVCIPQGPLDFEYPDGRPDLIASTGATVRVNVVGQNGGTPAPGTGMLHYSTGGGFTSVAMTVVSDNVYDAVFPPLPCGAEVTWYVSAESATGEDKGGDVERKPRRHQGECRNG